MAILQETLVGTSKGKNHSLIFTYDDGGSIAGTVGFLVLETSQSQLPPISLEVTAAALGDFIANVGTALGLIGGT